MDAFKTGQVTFVDVVRNGNPNTKVNVFDLVVGDVVNIRNGEKTCADIRVFQSNGIKVDNSPLNGETKAVTINCEPGEKGIHDPMEASNMMFYSTLIKEVIIIFFYYLKY
jgi:sodium/potassium-transporting ATPase subunit alpha